MDVDIGVIYTHEREYMTPLVTSLSQSGDGVRMRLILVDNVSAEGVAEWRDVFPETTVLRNDVRLGYGANLNEILAASTARYALLLNTDMWFDPAEQCVAKMVRFMDAHPDCGVSGCRLYHRDGSYGYPARRFQTLATIAGRRLGMARLFGQSIESYLYTEHEPTEILDCEWLSGCFLMVRTAAYRQVGGFDLQFRKYFEDVDFCLRMAIGGWRVKFNGQTFGYHYEQRSSRKPWSADGLQHLRSYARFLQKWGFDPARQIAPQEKIRRVA